MNTIRKQTTTDLALDEPIVVDGLSVYGVELGELRVRRGEVVALVGPNGSGKSSVSQVLVGALPASTGTARVLGLDPLDGAAALKGRLGFLVRDLETMGSLTSRDVLDICAAVRDCTTAYALELAARLELDLDQPMSRLSRGQLRRLGIVQALMHRPEVVVLDDPTTELDEAGCVTLAEVLREVAAEGAAVLVTAQSETEAESYADRIATFSQLTATDRSTTTAPAPVPMPEPPSAAEPTPAPESTAVPALGTAPATCSGSEVPAAAKPRILNRSSAPHGSVPRPAGDARRCRLTGSDPSARPPPGSRQVAHATIAGPPGR
ncbi:daunorubicin resistance protein DrrA family ABC transporter ATP-binding protein [Kribbella koreensis]|uniref:Daunorubicin resistance protein DrrA family ABC transporter ATP-binding protein n=2 Tax=Kribbella TaxID=182639 RepID=A0ABP6YW16_9ACTN